MAKGKINVQVGQHVTCFRTHDKFHKIEGEVVAVDEESGMVEVKTAATEGELSRVETVAATDVTVLPSSQAPPPRTSGATSGAKVVPSETQKKWGE